MPPAAISLVPPIWVAKSKLPLPLPPPLPLPMLLLTPTPTPMPTPMPTSKAVAGLVAPVLNAAMLGEEPPPGPEPGPDML